MWNRLPLYLREIIRPSTFKTELIKYIWTEFVFKADNSLPEDSDFDVEEGDGWTGNINFDGVVVVVDISSAYNDCNCYRYNINLKASSSQNISLA